MQLPDDSKQQSLNRDLQQITDKINFIFDSPGETATDRTENRQRLAKLRAQRSDIERQMAEIQRPSKDNRGVLHRVTSFHLVDFARRRFFDGRRFNRVSSTDVLSERTALKKRVKVSYFNDPSSDRPRENETLAETLSDTKEIGPAERARQNLDYRQILRQEHVGRQAQKVFRLLAAVRNTGCNKMMAKAMKVSPTRICQLKDRLAEALARHGYTP
jgi:hypothetical protein